jgi:hypothetical protein
MEVRGQRRVAWMLMGLVLPICLAGGGCGLLGERGQQVQLVAGGGDGAGGDGRAAESRLEARFLADMVVGADGTVRLLGVPASTDASLWTVSPEGHLRQQAVTGLDGRPTQMAVDQRGTVYVATGWRGVWRLEGGQDGSWSARRIVGDGRRGFSPDGTPAAQAALGLVQAVAVDSQAQLIFTELTQDPGAVTLVRMVQADGRLRTLAGTRRVPAGEDQRVEAIARGFRPAPGTPATSVLLFDSVQRALAVGDDGEVYVTTRGGALAIRDGTVPARLTPAEGSGDTVAEPFAPEGCVGDIGVDLAGPQTPDLAADPAGNLYLAGQTLKDDVPDGFRWTGDLGGARDLVETLFDGTARYRVRRVTPAGEVSTVAWHAGEVGVAGGWVYLAARAESGEVLVVRTRAP